MYQPGDRVQVKKSRSGYTGPGEVVDVAYGTNYLVRVPREEGDRSNPLILVPMTGMVHDRQTPPKEKKTKSRD